MTTPYEKQIRAIVPGNGYDPRHIEAFMRCEHSTLDGLSPRKFKAEVLIALDCIDQGGPEMAERIAQSFGF